MAGKSQHVIRNLNGGWSVHRYGASRATRNFDNQGDAVAYARRLARGEGGELFVHRQDGTVRSYHTFGTDRIAVRDAQDR